MNAAQHFHDTFIEKQKVKEAIEKICRHPLWSKLKDVPTETNRKLKQELGIDENV